MPVRDFSQNEISYALREMIWCLESTLFEYMTSLKYELVQNKSVLYLKKQLSALLCPAGT
jgi:hypothetical protein